MNNHTEAYYIQFCLSLIETQWQRGSSEDWKTYDFEKLSADIFDVTGVSLSMSTLKRLFGKVAYNNLPSLHTLNTVARFVGFEDWNAFKRQGVTPPPAAPAAAPTPQPSPTTVPPAPTRPARKPLSWWPLLLLPLAVLGYGLLSSTQTSSPIPLRPSDYSFSCNKVLTEGVPNSVVFKYDASAAPTDSVFIVQTWDMSRRTVVPKKGHDHSAIYYYPGYFNAKLVIDTQIVQTHDLMITSDGWLALAEGTPTPFYFKKEEYQREEGVIVDSALLAKNHFPFSPVPPKIRIFYMKDMGPLSDTNFTFETTLRNEFNSGSEACQHVEVLIQCKNDVFIIPLAAKACIGDLQLVAGGLGINSKGSDLSGFGCDLTQWTTLKIVTQNKHMQFMINGRPVYALDFPNPPEDIVGVQYRFRGGGSVKNTRFSHIEPDGGTRTLDLK